MGEWKDGWMEEWMGEGTPGWRYILGNKLLTILNKKLVITSVSHL